MKGVKKCYGLLLALPIMLGLSLSVCLDSSALSHDYKGIPLLYPVIPNAITSTSDGYKAIDWYSASVSGGNTVSLGGNTFSLISSNLSDSVSLKHGTGSSFISFGYSDESCNMGSTVSALLSTSYSNNTFYSSNGESYYMPSRWVGNSSLFGQYKCRFRNKFGQGNQPKLGSRQLNYNFPACNGQYGYFYSCIPINANLNSYFNTYFKSEYWYLYDGFYVNDSVTKINGETYTHNFSLSELYSKDITNVSFLRIPQYDYSDYWIEPRNFYAGREFEFKGFFNFKDGDVSFNPNVNTNGSKVYIKARVYSSESYNGVRGVQDLEFPCSTSLTRVEPEPSRVQYVFNYDCHFTLPFQSPYMFPSFVIDGNGENFWETDSSWSFGRLFVVTDNDETKGQDFGTDLTGNYIPGNASNYVDDDETASGIFDNLINLFTIDLLNPFSPIFNMFGTGSQCADIPIIAGMLYSSETRVCPFFSASIRNIVTPVIGLSSAMLTFGFAISWLKGRSSDVLSKGDK